MDVAVVISTYNRNDLRLKNCLRSLLLQNTQHNYQIYVIDYGSTDNLAQMLGELNSNRIQYLYVNRTPFNHSHANNIAIKNVQAPLLCFTDGYCVFRNTFINTIVEKYFPNTVMVYASLPYYIPEVYLTNPDIDIVANMEYYLSQGWDWLEERGVGRGLHKEHTFAADRDLLLQVQGYNEELLHDQEDTNMVRRLLGAGGMPTDISQDTLLGYQAFKKDAEVKVEQGRLQHQDIAFAEQLSAFRRNSPERNTNREWGQL
jgi:glycosyltransferase involved in cell wall biosynthesis